MATQPITEAARFARAIQSHRRAMLRAMDEVLSHDLTPSQRAALNAYLQVAELAVSALDPVGKGYLYKRKAKPCEDP